MTYCPDYQPTPDIDKQMSSNKEIDYFIPNTQIHAINIGMVSVGNFSDVEGIEKGGYGTVFRAKPKVQENHQWSHHEKDHSYYNEYVALKMMRDSESKDLLNAVGVA
jgi:hypothetical protein